MNSHLKHIPRLAPLSTRRLPRSHLETLCRKSDGPLDAQVLGFGTLNQLLADFFERGHFARC